jgi:trans-aconitate 2-methyltransferase
MAWDPTQYRRFAAERAQPFWDLAALVENDAPIHRAVDLGCGSGELTVELGERLGIGRLAGIDSSESMLAETPKDRDVTFALGDITGWTSAGDHDLVFANASLQWVPDHPTVLARWTNALGPGGQLAVQVPANADHQSHLIAAEVGASEPFAAAMGGTVPPDQVAANVLRPEDYAVLLHDLGFARQHVRLSVYGHVLDDTAAVADWVRGTSLTRFFAVLPTELHEQFFATYRERLVSLLGARSPYFYPFKRILMWARRA